MIMAFVYSRAGLEDIEAGTVNWCGCSSVVFYVRRQCGGNISVIETLQKRITFLNDVFAFFNRPGIDKCTAIEGLLMS